MRATSSSGRGSPRWWRISQTGLVLTGLLIIVGWLVFVPLAPVTEAPPVAETYVQFVPLPVICEGRVSTIEAPLTLLGPLLVTTIVYVVLVPAV